MPDTYTTTQGDTWDMIAYRQMGSEKRTHTLMAANPAHRGTVFFDAGQVLVIPDISSTTSTDPVPPWQR